MKKVGIFLSSATLLNIMWYSVWPCANLDENFEEFGTSEKSEPTPRS